MRKISPNISAKSGLFPTRWKARGFGITSLAVKAKGQRHLFARRREGGEQRQFLRRRFGKAVQPQGRDGQRFFWRAGQGLRGQVQKTVRILQMIPAQPGQVIAQQQGKVGQFPPQRPGQRRLGSQLEQRGGGKLVSLQFAQFQAELARETGQPGAGVENLQVLTPAGEEGVQDHGTTVFGKQPRRRLLQTIENEFGQAFKGKNLQARITGQSRMSKELPFQLEGCLLGSEQNQRRALRVFDQRLPNLRKAPERFARASRTEKKSRAHHSFVAQKCETVKEEGRAVGDSLQKCPGNSRLCPLSHCAAGIRLLQFRPKQSEQMQLLRRYLTILLLAMWMGGFTFYALIVIPTATKVLGNERQVGFTTQQVTHWLNLIGIVAILVFLWNAVAAGNGQTRWRRRGLMLAWGVMVLAHIGLFATHSVMDGLLDSKAFKVHDYDHFVNLHTTYLGFATTQWVAALSTCGCHCSAGDARTRRPSRSPFRRSSRGTKAPSVPRIKSILESLPFSSPKPGRCAIQGQVMISVQSLSKTFGAQVAVNGLSFTVPAGQILGFLGPNGAGKSTTLKMLTGMLEPSSGTATIAGFDLRQQPLEVKRHVRFRAGVGRGLRVLDRPGIFGNGGCALCASRRRRRASASRQFIAFFDLSFETLTDKLLGAYSKGMRRKVVITSALLHNPPVVFFDEPLDGLDANAAVGFKALIQTLAHEGKTIVYSSHILDVVERVCDRVMIIDKGRLLVDGRPDELVAAHASGTLEKLFTQLTGGTELQQRAEDFAKTFRP